MNIMNNDSEEYFNKLVLEIGILQEEIILPELPEEELSLEVLMRYDEEGKTYNLMQNCYKDMVGKFYIPVLFPLVDKSDGIEEYEYNYPRTQKSNGTIKPVRYSMVNYVELVIPKFIVMQFRNKIPKDTMFLIGFSGEHKKISNLNVVGIYGANIPLEGENDG